MSNSEWFEFELIYHLRPNKGKRVWGSWGEEGDEETSHWKVTRKITINLFFSKMMFSKFCYTDLHWWWELLRVLLFLEWARKHAHVFSPNQSCPTLCDPINWIPAGSSVHGILQARILERSAVSSSRGSSEPGDWTRVSCVPCVGRRILYHWVTWEAHGQEGHPHKWKFPLWKENVCPSSRALPAGFQLPFNSK